MTAGSLAGRDAWVFDLDNTLYPAACELFRQIDANMTAFIQDRFVLDRAEAFALQKALYVSHGTTLSGLMADHGVCPHEFMAAAHDVDVSDLPVDPGLREAMTALPGKRYVYTNGSLAHAENVATRLGVWDLFDGAFDVEMGGWTPKPHRAPYEAFVARFGIDPGRAVFFEDMAENLVVPHEMGMTTVLVQSDAAWLDEEPDAKRSARPGERPAHVHHATTDLTGFLAGLTRAAPDSDGAAA